jgi:hypothetical protein
MTRMLVVVGLLLGIAGYCLADPYTDRYNQAQQFQYQAQQRAWALQQQQRQGYGGYDDGGMQAPIPPVDLTPPVRTDTLPQLPRLGGGE